MIAVKKIFTVITVCVLLSFDAYASEVVSETTANELAVSYETAAPEFIVSDESAESPKSKRQIYLYGEIHGDKDLLRMEFELWNDYYHNENLRHLFVELPCYSADMLNLWMQAEDDEIFDQFFAGIAGTQMDTLLQRDLYRKIKSMCPETVFHGTDVGLDYRTNGEWVLNYLEENDLTESAQYLLTQEAIIQGKYFYAGFDDSQAYRENQMADNFVREFNKLNGESAMGIYGGDHVWPGDADNSTGSFPSMANQLIARYGDIVHSEQLWGRSKPIRTDKIKVGGKEYSAFYYGQADLTGIGKFSYREFWILEHTIALMDVYGKEACL